MSLRIRRPLLTMAVLWFAAFPAAAQLVELLHNVSSPTAYRVVSTNNQVIRLNGQFVREAQIVGWATISPNEPGDREMSFRAEFQLTTSSRQVGEPVQVLDYYNSTFTRSQIGVMDVPARHLMPVVRDLPVFPGMPVEPGETWSAVAREVHDLSQSYGLAEPLRFEFPVTYRYVGPAEFEGRELLRIDLSYNIFHRENRNAALYPRMIGGTSVQSIYWDPGKGRFAAKQEEYVIVFTLSDGQTIEYSGDVTTRTMDVLPLERSTAMDTITSEIEAAELQNTTVREVPAGVTISLESVGFPPDSAELLPSERQRLDRIARILSNYPNQAIVITGHTALAGSEEGRLELSIERARAVGHYLLRRGVRRPEEMLYRGVGADQPVADNATEVGRSRNRRVEITIRDR